MGALRNVSAAAVVVAAVIVVCLLFLWLAPHGAAETLKAQALQKVQAPLGEISSLAELRKHVRSVTLFRKGPSGTLARVQASGKRARDLLPSHVTGTFFVLNRDQTAALAHLYIGGGKIKEADYNRRFSGGAGFHSDSAQSAVRTTGPLKESMLPIVPLLAHATGPLLVHTAGAEVARQVYRAASAPAGPSRSSDHALVKAFGDPYSYTHAGWQRLLYPDGPAARRESQEWWAALSPKVKKDFAPGDVVLGVITLAAQEPAYESTRRW